MSIGQYLPLPPQWLSIKLVGPDGEWLFTAARSLFQLPAYDSGSVLIRGLRHYVQSAILPWAAIGRDRHRAREKNHNISTKFELYGDLEHASVIPASDFKSSVAKFIELNVPESDSIEFPVQYQRFTVDVEGYGIPNRYVPEAQDVRGIKEFVRDFPLQTVRYVMPELFPETWYYALEEKQDVDCELIRWIQWVPQDLKPWELRGGPQIKLPRDPNSPEPMVNVFIQHPDVLQRMDLESFVRRSRFPRPNSILAGGIKQSHRLWAKIYDVCNQSHSPWFVLTTYEEWVFGVFSQGYTRAWTSGVLPRDCTSPTIVECLSFWFASAFSAPRDEPVPGAWVIPQVPAPIRGEDYPYSAIEQELETPEKEYRPPGSSATEEEWTARSSARTHTASGNVSFDDDASTVMQLMHGGGERPRPRTGYTPSEIDGWRPSVHGHPFDFAPSQSSSRSSSPTPSQSTVTSTTTATSASTVRDYGSVDLRAGAYLPADAYEVVMA